MSKHSRKQSLNLAGEFFVAAQLQRMNVMAVVTYGNAKQADVVAFCPEAHSAVVIEVKTTSESQWVVGSRLPERSKQPWVFVYLPPAPTDPPRYFILTATELHDILSVRHTTYLVKYREKHGSEFSGKGVVKLSKEQALPFEGTWERITEQVLNEKTRSLEP